MDKFEVDDQPSWIAVDHWLEKEEAKAIASGKPYGYGNLSKYHKTPGVFAIYFDSTKEVYFGSSNNLYLQRIKHIVDLRRCVHRCIDMQRVFDKSELNAIMFFYKETVNYEEAKILQQKFMDDYSGNHKLLNNAECNRRTSETNNRFRNEERRSDKIYSSIENKQDLKVTMLTTIETDMIEKETLVNNNISKTGKGIILYSDGACRPTNPGNIGWGVHGYLFQNELPKKGAGNTTHILTTSGYIPKVAKVQNGFTEIKVLNYFDFFGSSLEQNSNNVAELEATRNALVKASEFEVDTITIYTDSEYVRRGVEEWSPTWVRRNWIKADGTPVPNAKYWKMLLEVLNALKGKGILVKINWVKGHNEILGNVMADKLATIGAMYSIQRMVRNEFTVSAPEGYWKLTSEKHPFISNKRMYFNTISSSQIPGEYYLGDHGNDDDMLGKKSSETAFSIIQLAQPDPVMERLRNYQTSIACDIDSIIIARTDKLFSPETYQEIIDYENGAFVRANSYTFDINSLDGKPLSKELRPARIAMRAIEALSCLKDKLDIFKLLEANSHVNPSTLMKFKTHDITDVFYEKETKLKKKIEETTLKLKTEFNVGFSALQVKTVVEKDDKDFEINLTLTLGVDLPERNGLKKLEEMNPSVNLVTWSEGKNIIRFAVIIKAEGSYGIWAGIYSNLVFI